MSEVERVINLYVAVLNHQKVRSELHYVLNEMGNTPGVKVTVQHLTRTWANNIFVNRNKIVKKFLEYSPSQDFLMMLDDDVIPVNHNPAELVFANKDIIGSPAKVRQVGRAINWVAYLKHPELEYYAPIDFAKVSSQIDLLRCDVVGTGLIIIKRKVLEAMKGIGGAFTIEMDEDGLEKFGTDFAFCRRATKLGFEVYTTPQRVCEHYKEVGLMDIQGYDDCDMRDFSSGKYDIAWGEWAISQRDWEFIRNVILKEKPERILEFGSGLSSLLMSETVPVISYETDEECAKFVESKKTPENKLEVRIWDGSDIVEQEELKHKGFGLCFIDGPPGLCNGGVGRRASFRIATELCDKIIVHDAGRKEETGLQIEFLRDWYDLAGRSGWHQARCQFWKKREKQVS